MTDEVWLIPDEISHVLRTCFTCVLSLENLFSYYVSGAGNYFIVVLMLCRLHTSLERLTITLLVMCCCQVVLWLTLDLSLWNLDRYKLWSIHTNYNTIVKVFANSVCHRALHLWKNKLTLRLLLGQKLQNWNPLTITRKQKKLFK